MALELELDDELRREGLAREIVHAVQNARKAAGLQVEDRIELRLGGDDELLAAAREHEAYVAGETLAAGGRLRGTATAPLRPSRAASCAIARAHEGSRRRARARARPRGASSASRR